MTSSRVLVDDQPNALIGRERGGAGTIVKHMRVASYRIIQRLITRHMAGGKVRQQRDVQATKQAKLSGKRRARHNHAQRRRRLQQR